MLTLWLYSLEFVDDQVDIDPVVVLALEGVGAVGGVGQHVVRGVHVSFHVLHVLKLEQPITDSPLHALTSLMVI